MTILTTFLVLLGSGAVWQVRGGNPKVREFFMYRGTKDVLKNPYIQENVDLADLPGALKYIHTEIIAESSQSDFQRKKRKYDIDMMARWAVLVNNPGVIIDMNQPPMAFADFGPFVTFDYGQATNAGPLAQLENLGDFVGAQSQTSPSWPYRDPYYWFSLSGFCPNLPYVCTNGWNDSPECNHNPPISTAMCPIDDPCPDKGTRDNPRTGPKGCTTDTGPGQGVLKGGLCGKHNGREDKIKFQEPEGIPGCTYSYDHEKIQQVALDELVGIRQEDCMEGKCSDWYDFRLHCTNPKYKTRYDNTIPPKIIEFEYCIEYDIHPACAANCTSPECLAVPEDDRELGLPFWQGRCNGQRNMERAEALASLYNIKHATTGHNILEKNSDDYKNRMCDRSKDTPKGTLQCAANVRVGGAFCTRAWGGVCTSCYIPGTKEPFSNVDLPWCPLDIVTLPDYKGQVEAECPGGSCCKDASPSSRCCLYFDSCQVNGQPMKIKDLQKGNDQVYKIINTEDGAILLEATQDTEVVTEYLKALLQEIWGLPENPMDRNLTSQEEAALRKVAYWSWGKAPARGLRLEAAIAGLRTIWPTAGDTTTPAPPTIAPTTAPEANGTEPIMYLVYILIAVVVLGGIFFVYTKMTGGAGGRRSSRDALVQDNSQELSGSTTRF